MSSIENRSVSFLVLFPIAGRPREVSKCAQRDDSRELPERVIEVLVRPGLVDQPRPAGEIGEAVELVRDRRRPVGEEVVAVVSEDVGLSLPAVVGSSAPLTVPWNRSIAPMISLGASTRRPTARFGT